MKMLYNVPNISSFLKAEYKWAGYIWRAGKKCMRNVLTKNPTKEQSRGKPNQQGLDSLKGYFKYW